MKNFKTDFKKTWLLATGVLLALIVASAYAQPIFSNNLFLLGGNAGVAPQIQALGTDTNISINLVPKGTGTVQVNGTAIPGISGGAGSFTTLSVSGAATFNGIQQVLLGGVLHQDGGVPIFHNTTDAGTGADVTEDTLHTFTMPASTLTTAGAYVRIQTYIHNAANANTKQTRVYFGATVIGNSTLVSTNNTPYVVWCDVFMLTTTTQKAYCTAFLAGTVNSAWNSAVGGGYDFTTPAETLTGTVVIKVTGQNGVATANDTVAKTTTVTWYPNGQ